ncbi:E3 ubiquitin-protein ligase COP1 [Parasteatoda tepidariorum]|uniref:E3 ubiquitin-protein ligase COP1 n=1 Tax=Parasteatoda tepidariorum TaxID=114398 RepID=UPI00077FCD42|nr:E3 ubiquitin-protein ligase COP1 [Parasteatoda tepidariorum]
MAESISSNRSLLAASSDGPRRVKKRPNPPPIFNGTAPSEIRNTELLCSLCYNLINEAHMTKCGHTYCYACIKTAIETQKKCPKCSTPIESVDEIFPNCLLNEVVAKEKSRIPSKRVKCCPEHTDSLFELQSFLSKEKCNLTIEEVNLMLEVLAQKKQQLEADCRETELLILREFLEEVQRHKKEELKRIQEQLQMVDGDISVVKDTLKSHVLMYPPQKQIKCEPSTSAVNNCSLNLGNCSYAKKQDGFNGSKYVSKTCVAPSFNSRKKRMYEHYNDLQKSYFNLKSLDSIPSENGSMRTSGIDLFEENLIKFTRFSYVRPLAALNYSNDSFNGSNIVSSIEFEKDNEYFAIAGVTKKIKVYEYASVIRDPIDVHCPVNEMVCNQKISCISWSSFHKNMLASSDYEGTVTLWDAFTNQKVKTYQEHEKRCWSVDFNKVDTKLIASGSDDSKVKLWMTNMEHSCATLEAKANVCCVKFSPSSKYHLAFGSADHCVHYYDLRKLSEAQQVFKGHKKAVSYVKFLNAEEIVSASTDSQLKLWDVLHQNALRSFKGHLNEKNFVGLATDGDFITCGSENNSLYVYYKGLSSPVLTFKFETFKSILDRNVKEDDSNEFVSAVCWRMGSNVVVAANSQGNIKILELV